MTYNYKIQTMKIYTTNHIHNVLVYLRHARKLNCFACNTAAVHETQLTTDSLLHIELQLIDYLLWRLLTAFAIIGNMNIMHS